MTSTTTESAAVAAPWSEEVEQFVVAHGLRADLLLALELVARAFGPRAECASRIQYSPDFWNGRLLIEIVATTDPTTARECRDVLADRWIRELPLRAQDDMVFTYTTA
jgi:hypothetical protein